MKDLGVIEIKGKIIVFHKYSQFTPRKDSYKRDWHSTKPERSYRNPFDTPQRDHDRESDKGGDDKMDVDGENGS
jgi:hypothetical protein